MLEKKPKFFLFFLLFTLIAVNVELDIFLPSLMDMQKYFKTKDGEIEYVLTLNFVGLCISGFICGYLSDIFGRKKIILSGMFVFILGSIGCVFTKSLSYFLLFRFLQGIGCGAPATVSFAAVCDIYSKEKATQVISIFNGLITGTMVGAPLLGVTLSNQWGWRSNFIFIAIFSIIAFILLLFFLDETLKNTSSLQPKQFFHSIAEIFFMKNFWANGSIAILMYSSLIVFVSNFPLIAIGHLQLTENIYAWLQALVMFSFVLASFLCAFLVKKIKNSRMILMGLMFAVIGCLALLKITHSIHSLSFLILSITCFNIGAAFLIAIFSTRVLDQPKTKGTASSLMGSLRMLTAAGFIAISTIFYNGTFKPIGWLILVGTLGVCILLFISKKDFLRQ